jgi:hypothetical protein
MLMLCWACQQPTASQRFPYTTADFQMPLRGIMEKMEQQNIVFLEFSGCRGDGSNVAKAQTFYYEFLRAAGLDDLKLASKCSNPVIRASALMALMMQGADPPELIKEHLYDTAVVFDDYSAKRWSVISFLVHHAEHWQTKDDRREIERLLLENRPFEEVSYDIMALERHTDTFPGFYAIARKMVEHFEPYAADDRIDWYSGIKAMERLASYRYQQDIPLLSKILEYLEMNGNGNFYPGVVIKQFPDTAFDKFYLDTSATWYRQLRFMRSSQHGDYASYYEDGFNEFLALVIEHKSAKSARLLERFLEQSPFESFAFRSMGIQQLQRCTEWLYQAIALGIRENACSYYAKLLPRTAKHLKKESQRVGSEPYPEVSYRKLDGPAEETADKKENDKPYVASWYQ